MYTDRLNGQHYFIGDLVVCDRDTRYEHTFVVIVPEKFHRFWKKRYRTKRESIEDLLCGEIITSKSPIYKVGHMYNYKDSNSLVLIKRETNIFNDPKYQSLYE